MTTHRKTLAAWFAVPLAALLIAPVPAGAQVYKIVDDDGNVTYTDQAPGDGSEPMDLPDLSVVETEPAQAPPGLSDDENEAGSSEPTPRELRHMFANFRISRPQQEETFWGTGNQVVVGWEASNPLLPDMSVRLYVNGEPQSTPGTSLVALTLDRGEYTVFAELLDSRGRRVVTTEPVTFFVKQNSRRFNPGGGAGGGAR